MIRFIMIKPLRSYVWHYFVSSVIGVGEECSAQR